MRCGRRMTSEHDVKKETHISGDALASVNDIAQTPDSVSEIPLFLFFAVLFPGLPAGLARNWRGYLSPSPPRLAPGRLTNGGAVAFGHSRNGHLPSYQGEGKKKKNQTVQDVCSQHEQSSRAHSPSGRPVYSKARVGFSPHALARVQQRYL